MEIKDKVWKDIVVIFMALLFFGCAQKVDLMDGAQYQRNHDWCMNHSTPGKTPVQTETYQQCMERFGYKFK